MEEDNGTRRKSKYAMIGNSQYRGKDKIRPPEWKMTLVTLAQILIPSTPTQFYIPFLLCGWVGGFILAILYAVSLANVLRCLYLVSRVEPGIIPKVKSKVINYTRPYKVTYRESDDPSDVTKELNPIEAYFSVSHFKICPEDTTEIDPKKIEVLSACTTCGIVRPPRSYHCGECGYCVEIHDHHCPWMGTCIGLRNIRYFVCFLAYTSMHAAITFTINMIYFALKTYPVADQIFKHHNKNDESEGDEDYEHVTKGMRVVHLINIACSIYAFMIFLFLLFFALSMHD